MSELSITNVINISVSEQGKGAGEYNTSNLALFTRETQTLVPVLGYELYLGASDVLKNFGSSSLSGKVASAIFGQTKNILSGGGYLAVIPFIAPTQSLTLDGVPVSGGFSLTYDGGVPVPFLFADLATSATFQAKLRTIVGLESAIVTLAGGGLIYTVSFEGFETVPVLLSVSASTMVDVGAGAVTITPLAVLGLETLQEAVVRTKDIVEFFGVLSTDLVKGAELPAMSTYIQTLKKMYFPVSITKADLEIDGLFHDVVKASLDQTRCLYIGRTLAEAVAYAGAYASRGMSTNFDGSRTTQTMHLKDLKGILPDETISQTDIVTCKTTGVDLYVSIQGVAKEFTSNGNVFFDRIYNKLWFVGRLEIDGFNVLATTSTKIPQTESGIALLLKAYRGVCEQAITNEFVSRGTWNSPDTFGNLEDFHANIEERGYYIYSAPLSQQSALARENREAPVAQIAIKEAGAVHSADLIIYINA